MFSSIFNIREFWVLSWYTNKYPHCKSQLHISKVTEYIRNNAISLKISLTYTNHQFNLFIIQYDLKLDEQKKLSQQAITSISDMADENSKKLATDYARDSALLLNGSNTKEVLISLGAIIKYLRDIAASPANKKQITPANKPPISKF